MIIKFIIRSDRYLFHHQFQRLQIKSEICCCLTAAFQAPQLQDYCQVWPNDYFQDPLIFLKHYHLTEHLQIHLAIRGRELRIFG